MGNDIKAIQLFPMWMGRKVSNYTVSQNKTRHYNLAHNYAKC